MLRRRSTSCRSQNLVAQRRVEGFQEHRREQYRETDHQPHDAVTLRRLKQRLRNADRNPDCDQTEDNADAAREIEQARGRAFATARRESEPERLRQRQDNRARKCDKWKPNQERREGVHERADQQASAVNETHHPEDANDAVPIREPACDRRTGDIRDRDNRDDRRSNGGRTPDSPDDVEDDEALQTREAELPESVHDTEDAQAW